LCTHTAAKTSIHIEGCGFTQFVSDRSIISERECPDRTTLHAESARLARGLSDLNTIIRKVVAFFLLQHVGYLEEDAGTPAAIADRVRVLLPV
jgi:hypothetical protein